ncbi:unnamed protein product [Timema podura]|uniref:Uncharacterized protein n=1 Tax=Timema podura TaxID=61482 RepID=A0ABN7P7Q7_TIMPD|nr:unnamed protein product [Timema podura]
MAPTRKETRLISFLATRVEEVDHKHDIEMLNKLT